MITELGRGHGGQRETEKPRVETHQTNQETRGGEGRKDPGRVGSRSHWTPGVGPGGGAVRGGGEEHEGESERRAGAAVPGDPRGLGPHPSTQVGPPPEGQSCLLFPQSLSSASLGRVVGRRYAPGGPQYCQAGNVCVEGGGNLL